MSFPRYPRYKPSGVGWLGEVPDEWTVCALGYRYEVALGKMLDTKQVTGRHLGPYLRNSDVQWGRVRVSDLPEMDFDAEDRERFRLRAGDLLVCEGGEVGRCAVWQGALAECYYQKALHRLRPLNPVSDTSDYFQWVLQAAARRGAFASSEEKATIAHLPAETLRRHRFPFPTADDQQAIARFLALHAGKVDDLIESQGRLLERLAEKRQAVISQAVTKGLNPDAPMKPSGIEWLGDVPAHWTVCHVGARYSVQLGKMLDSGRITGWNLRPYLRVADVQWDEINTSELPQMDFEPGERDRFALKAGDLLVNEGGSYPGRTAIWDGSFGECYYQKALHRLRTFDEQRDWARFFYYVMAWAVPHGVFAAGGNEATIQHVPAEKLRRYRFGFPAFEEQREIAGHLDCEVARLGAMRAEAEHAIALLQERRAALITAAVTGQIDVRGLVPQEAAS